MTARASEGPTTDLGSGMTDAQVWDLLFHYAPRCVGVGVGNQGEGLKIPTQN